MKKRMVFGSIALVFLMLLIPQVNAIEYNQVVNTVSEDMSGATNYLMRHHFSSFVLGSTTEQVTEIFGEITQNLDGICNSCLKESRYETCGELFIEYITLLFLAGIFAMTIILIPLSLVLLHQANAVYDQAQDQGCLWTGG